MHQNNQSVPFPLILILAVLVSESFITSWYSSAIHSKLKVGAPVKLPFALAIVKTLILAIGIFLGNIGSIALPWFYTAMAYAMMFIIGLKMITESLRFSPEERIVLIDNNKTLILLGLAGSFNSLFIGLSLGLIGTDILMPCLFLFIFTLILSLTSLYFGKKLGLRPYLRYIGIVGGLIIAGIAIRFFINYFLK